MDIVYSILQGLSNMWGKLYWLPLVAGVVVLILYTWDGYEEWRCDIRNLPFWLLVDAIFMAGYFSGSEKISNLVVMVLVALGSWGIVWILAVTICVIIYSCYEGLMERRRRNRPDSDAHENTTQLRD